MARLELYGLNGELLGVYRPATSWPVLCEERVYFAGRLVEHYNAEAYYWESPTRDRLGSLRAARRYPFGEGNNADNDEFATYRKDTSTQHCYAWHRYYSATWGRFSSPDPYVMSGGLTHPQGWNRYSYVGNDPVNYYDPSGLLQEAPTFKITVTASAKGLGELELWWLLTRRKWIAEPGGGGRPAPPEPSVRPFDPKSLLPGMRARAIDGALDVLRKNVNCAKIYGVNGKGLGPVDLLQKLAAGDTEYGAIRYGAIKELTVSATTIALVVEPESSLEAGALITLNDNLGSHWFLGEEQDRVLTILHELAHAFDVIYGQGSSALPANERETGISETEQVKRSVENTAFVREKCLR